MTISGRSGKQSSLSALCRSFLFALTVAGFLLTLTGCGGSPSQTSSQPPATPAPTIGSISPSSVLAGNGGFTLTVNGSNFNSSSTVRWDGSTRPTVYVGNTQLRASISAGDVADAAYRTVTVRNTTPSSASSNGITFNITNLTPTITLLNPKIFTAGSEGFTLIIYGRNFMQDATVRKDDDLSSSSYISSTELSIYVSDIELINPKTINISVRNPYGSSWSNTLPLEVTSPEISVLTTTLPSATPGKEYSYYLQASGGIPDYSWQLESGSLPTGLHLINSGLIGGTLPDVLPETTYSFTVRVNDSAQSTDPFAQPNTTLQDLSIQSRNVVSGRNDICGVDTATPVSNGLLRASISPYGDIDVYSFQGTQDSSLNVELFSQRLDTDDDPTSQDVFLDTFLEILDDGCHPLQVNDDIDLGVIYDSLISDYLLPYTGMYYIRVSDLRGDGRPDFQYDLSLSGAD